MKRLPPGSARLTTMLSSGRKVGVVLGSWLFCSATTPSSSSSWSAVFFFRTKRAAPAASSASTTTPTMMNSSFLLFGLAAVASAAGLAGAAAADIGFLQWAPCWGRHTLENVWGTEELLSAPVARVARKRAGKARYSTASATRTAPPLHEHVQRLAAVAARTGRRRGLGRLHRPGRAPGRRARGPGPPPPPAPPRRGGGRRLQARARRGCRPVNGFTRLA